MTLPNAFITLLTTSSYLPGALVLLHAIHDLHPAPRDFKIVCLVTPETVDARTIGEVRKAGFDLVIGVEPIGSGVPGQDALDLMGGWALPCFQLLWSPSFWSFGVFAASSPLPFECWAMAH